MGEHRHPESLLPGDVVSPLFNPSKRIVFTHTGIGKLRAVLAKHNPEMADTVVRVVYGTDALLGDDTQLTIGLDDEVRLDKAMPRKGER